MVLLNDDPRLHDRLLGLLEAGGVAIIPCDTIYGFVGRVPDTEERIRRIKGRGETNPFLMLVGTAEQAASLSSVALDEAVVSLWPAPLTLVLPTRDSTVAVRVPNDSFLSEVIATLGAPIYSTSANRSGRAPMWQIEAIIAEFEHEVDLIVDQGDIPAGQPSTILDLTRKPYLILRQGEFRVPPELLSD